ncbi:hypothetical protein ACS0PU_003319 [Formica fusca]
METLPSTSRSSDEVDSIKNSCKMLYFETLDILLSELKRRFDSNDKLIEAVSSINEFDLDKLKYLFELGIDMPSKEELMVVREYLQRKPGEDIFKMLYNQRDAFKKIYELYATVAVFGCSTAVNESSFSTLTRINRPQRYSMSHQRMANLIFLASEKEKTKNIDLEVFLKKFYPKKNRKLQLF